MLFGLAQSAGSVSRTGNEKKEHLTYIDAQQVETIWSKQVYFPLLCHFTHIFGTMSRFSSASHCGNDFSQWNDAMEHPLNILK